MTITLASAGNACRLTFDGSLTYDSWREMEDTIIDALRRHTLFEMDLSGIRDIDLCGVHLLEMLRSVGKTQVQVVAGSAVVDQASERLLTPQRLSTLACRTRRSQIVEDFRNGVLQPARGTAAC